MMWAVLALALCVSAVSCNPCVPRDFGNGGVVCVCNATYCDLSLHITVPERGQCLQYTSSIDGLRLEQSEKYFSNETTATLTLHLNSGVKYQKIKGFGGAFTDSAGINIKSLSSGAQDNLLSSYFSKNGSSYSLGRVPIAGTDFSTRVYSYDDVNDDINLDHFSLAEEDLIYKIPLMQKALQMNSELRFLSAAWSAPAWMKTNNDLVGVGFLEPKYYQLYTDYLMKFLDKYKDHGLQIWAITTGNEPTNTIVGSITFESMVWTPTTVSKWIAENLGPTIRSSVHNKTLILALDDQRFDLPIYIMEMFNNKAAQNYTDGIAVHWYWDNIVEPLAIDNTHALYPDKFLLMTEACIANTLPDDPVVSLGSWARGERYITSIMQDLNHWMTGWVDWNLALNPEGGPNWNENFVDAAIIVNATADEFYKQPTFYALAHFSKFVPPGSERIQITEKKHIKSVAFRTPINEIVVILYNKNNDTQKITVRDPDRGNINLELQKRSLHTIIYK